MYLILDSYFVETSVERSLSFDYGYRN